MSFTATVENDTVKFPAGVHLPDGTKVNIAPVVADIERQPPPQTFAERYAEFIGAWKDGPTDLAENHDHYASGAPKQQP